MLSAIAARKAALTARQESNTPAPSVESAPSPPKPVEPVLVLKPTSKRKSSAQTLHPPKRKKKEKKKPTKPPRYFAEPDSFKAQEDVIVIDSDEEIMSDDKEPPIAVQSNRRWSPSIPLNDSSDEGEDVSFVVPPTASPQNPKPTTLEIFSTFQPTLDQNTFLLDSAQVSTLDIDCDIQLNATIVALASTETICLLGTYSVCVLQGSITIFGTTLPASRKRYQVFAPRSSPLPVLEGVHGTGAIADIEKLPKPLHSLIGTSTTLVLLQEHYTGIQGLGRTCRTFEGVFEPSRWQRSSVTSPLRLSGVHMVEQQTKDTQTFDLPYSWAAALASAPSDTAVGVHLVKGPKKSGKSTFARTLVNKLLSQYQKVAYLECDIGQSEFTPGGMVALNLVENHLFGPPFTHPTLPTFSHYIGATTPRSSPTHYLAAIQSILESYRLDIQTAALSYIIHEDDARISDTVPLVINTMGWNKGLGADLTFKIQEMAEPTDIYEVEAPAFDSAWPAPPPKVHYSASPVAKHHHLQPVPHSVLTTNYSAADHRTIAMMSYFHAIFPISRPSEYGQITASSWDTTLPLCALPPYEVDAAVTLDKVVLTGAGTEDVVPTEVWRVLNGAVVALVECEPGTIDLDLDLPTSGSMHVPYTQGFAVPAPATSTCYGLALLRSISPTSGQMHLLTPLPHELLAKSRVLIKGEMDLPIWGMLDFRNEGEDVAGVEKGKVPYLQWGKGEGIGGEKRRVRRNLMRKGQM